MIANARMYSVTPVVAELWRHLLTGIARKSGLGIDIIDYAAPKPMSELLQRPDKAAVFMCGLPYSLATPRPLLIAAPVPHHGHATYWTEFVVAADSKFRRIEDTFGGRIAFTTPDSQSGFAAPLRYLMAAVGAHPLYAEIVAPTVTPVGALEAVVEGRADVAPLDSYALALLRHHAPAQAARVRSIASTEPTAIPPLVASPGGPTQLSAIFGGAHQDKELAPLLDGLLLQCFVLPEQAGYEALARDFETTKRFWRDHPFARTAHPAFAELQAIDRPGGMR